jgi:inner membrane transporter RhtA
MLGVMSRITGIALMTGSAASNQVGAATAALAFGSLGPAGVVAIRQWVAAAVLFSSVRPSFASFTGRQWRPVLALALIFATMNLSLYLAISRIGLGLAVTLEFLGPLSVGLLASRRLLNLFCALVAGAAVVVLARPSASTDYAGIALALLAAACWAGYIVVNRVVGARVPGAQGPAAAACLSACLYIPVGVWVLVHDQVTLVALGRAAVAGVLCSAVPMVVDLRALRFVPPGFYGVFMSVNPVFAALTGLVLLGQRLGLADWLSIGVIVTVNAVCAMRSAEGAKLPLVAADRTIAAGQDELPAGHQPPTGIWRRGQPLRGPEISGHGDDPLDQPLGPGTRLPGPAGILGHDHLSAPELPDTRLADEHPVAVAERRLHAQALHRDHGVPASRNRDDGQACRDQPQRPAQRVAQ